MKIKILFWTLIACLIMFIIESLTLPYLTKSIFKLTMFFIIPVIYFIIKKNYNALSFLKINSIKKLVIPTLLGIGTYIIIFAGFIVIKRFIDINQIITALNSNNISAGNFIYVSLYICIINSFIEEFIFRGLTAITLAIYIKPIYSYIISSFIFAIYHVSIMATWFDIRILIFLITSLFFCGMFFCYLNRKELNIYNSWTVHAFANLSINTIGFLMFNQIIY